MNRLTRFLLTAASLGCLTTFTALADDKDAVIAAAQKAQDEAPACRVRMSMTDSIAKTTTTLLLESVKPDQFHVTMSANDKPMMEMVSDGKKSFVSQGGAPMVAVPDSAAGQMGGVKQAAAISALMKDAEGFKLSGHETVGGVPASVYTFTSKENGAVGNNKLWISDQDHRPLKAEGDIKGETTKDGATTKVDQKASAVFDYDPSIKITLPAK